MLYDRFLTRHLKYYRGLAQTHPMMSLALLLLMLAQIAIPGTMHFIAELLIGCGTFRINHIAAFLASHSILVSAGYSFWLVLRCLSGIEAYASVGFNDMNLREATEISVLSVPLFVAGMSNLASSLFISGILQSLPYMQYQGRDRVIALQPSIKLLGCLLSYWRRERVGRIEPLGVMDRLVAT
jgi:NADH:ubiquinone oxidoreductase subunit 4 (subunit M)